MSERAKKCLAQNIIALKKRWRGEKRGGSWSERDRERKGATKGERKIAGEKERSRPSIHNNKLRTKSNLWRKMRRYQNIWYKNQLYQHKISINNLSVNWMRSRHIVRLLLVFFHPYFIDHYDWKERRKNKIQIYYRVIRH